MKAVDILKKWLAYTEYDPERKSFLLGSLTSEFHSCNQTISKFMPYNPSGEIAVLYAKHCFQKIMKEQRLNAFVVISQPEQLQSHWDMWKLFCSTDVQAIEESILNDFNVLLADIVPTKMVGKRDLDAEKEAIVGAVEAVVEEIHKCNVDLFLKGGTIGRITNFSTHIHVFNQLAECLLTLEQSPDGIYLCYIMNYGAVDGYFGFYMKSNGSILSVNERLHEAYPGAHKNHRNNRYAEEKQYQLFPYNFIFSFEETNPDYKGYATTHIINEEQLAFFKLTPKAYLPLVIAMVLLRNRYDGFIPAELEQQYVDSLLPVNLALPTPGTQALMVPGDSMIAAANRGWDISFTVEDVMNGDMVQLLNRPAVNCTDSEKFGFYQKPEENIFIQKYGEGFTLNTASLMESNRHLKMLTASQLAATQQKPNAEFVGDAQRMTKIAYMNGRAQLAEYIRDKMFEAYKAQGGVQAVKAWWEAAVPTVRDKLIPMCVEKYRKGEEFNQTVGEGKFRVIMDLDSTERPTWIHFAPYPLNTWGTYPSGNVDYTRPLCCITGQKASHYFTFYVETYEQMVSLMGAENVPEILTGYRRDGHRAYGNPILEATDPMTGVGTPFEDHEYQVNRRLWTAARWEAYIRDYFDDYCPKENQYKPCWPSAFVPKDALAERPTYEFSFVIAFSKRGFAKALKGEYHEKL